MPDESLDVRYPKPTLSDLMTMDARLERTMAQWAAMVQRVREHRFHADQLPQKWQERLGISEDQRFRTNLSDNEVSRVVALMTRNRPKVYVPPAGESPQAVRRSQTQTRWGHEILEALERQSVLPVWDRLDDAAVETGLGVLEVFLTEDYDRYQEIQEELAGKVSAARRRELEGELQAYGLPFGVRVLDPTTVRWEPSYGRRQTEAVLIKERKNYRQLFGQLYDALGPEALAERKLPPIAALGMPQSHVWNVQTELGIENFAPDQDGEVDVLRYYDSRWLIEYVAGVEVQAVEHGWPGIPLFLQFGKTTSSSYQGYMLRGVTFGMLEHEQIVNDILTLWEDNQFRYSRPFPVVQTSEQGTPLTDRNGDPRPVHLDDPTRPPQLGPGQTIADAFGDFRGNIDPQFIAMLNQYFHMSGLNPIATGESPGADTSGFALNTQQTAATALYASLLKNKQRAQASLLDFLRLAVRDTLEFPVTVAAGGENGQPLEYVTLRPEDVDEVPTRVFIDPLSDAQRMAVTQWALNGMHEGLIQRRTVQRVAYGSVIDDQEAEDKGILMDEAKRGILAVLVQAVVQRVVGDAFPELAPPAAPGGPGAPAAPGTSPPGLAPPSPATIGREGAQASRVTPGGQSPGQAVANMGRGGQQPANQPPAPGVA